MPKISAPTVAEHRERQRQALIQAAIDILVEEGAAAVTPAAVGARAGLARSSVYQYFSSSAALLATIVEEAFPAANAAVDEALAEAATPAERIDAFIATTLLLAADGAHRPAAALMGADLPPMCRARLDELHLEQVRPLIEAIGELAPPDPALTCRLVGGLLQAAMAEVDAGNDPRTVIERTLHLLHHGLDERAQRSRQAMPPAV